jgi:tetratricopeptide (TPR) repeat protein
LGSLALERFREAQAAKKPKDELTLHLNEALEYYNEALDLLPSNAVNDLAVVHNQLGHVYHYAGELDRALHHYNKGIQYYEAAGNLFGAAQTRYNVALDLAQAGRFGDALLYAQAALRNYETYDKRAAKEIKETKDLIAEIEQEMKE